MRVCDLVHQMRQEDNFEVIATAFKALGHLHFIFLGVACKDAQGIVVVDNRRFGGNQSVVVQKTRTKAMHVTHIHFGCSNIVDVGLYALYHTACSTVCEGKT